MCEIELEYRKLKEALELWQKTHPGKDPLIQFAPLFRLLRFNDPTIID